MNAHNSSVATDTFAEKIIYNVRNTPLKKELIECINDLPDEILLTIKPLFRLLIENTMTIEQVSYDELTEKEKAGIEQAQLEYERGDYVRFESAKEMAAHFGVSI